MPLLREPLLHFAILGAILFLWIGERAPAAQPPPPAAKTTSTTPAPRHLRVDADVRAALVAAHLARTRETPDAATLEALIDRWIDEEILHREAQRLGLDRDDVIVRRRLIQKMQFLAETMTPIHEPDDAALDRFMRAHPERYSTPPAVSFEHVFFRDRPDAPAKTRAEHARRALTEEDASPQSLGDGFVHGARFTSVSPRRLENLLGPTFAATVVALPVSDAWSSPLESSAGVHLVRVDARQSGALPTLARVRSRVRRDFIDDALERARDEGVAALRARYTIEVIE